MCFGALVSYTFHFKWAQFSGRLTSYCTASEAVKPVGLNTQNSLGCRHSLCTSTKSVSSFIADPCVIRCHLYGVHQQRFEICVLCTLSAVTGRKNLGINCRCSWVFCCMVFTRPGSTSSNDAHCWVISHKCTLEESNGRRCDLIYTLTAAYAFSF